MDASTASGMEPVSLVFDVLLSICNKQLDTVVADAKTSGAILLSAVFPFMTGELMKQEYSRKKNE